MPSPGDVIHGKYRLVRLIGDGGMGSIYEARHEILGSHVALKFLHPDLARRPNLLARFLQEAQLSATLQSPHIVQVSDIGQEGSGSSAVAFLVMELLRGETLQALLDRTRPLETSMAIEIAMQILNGLDVAHHGGVVHRDLKPENIYLVPAPYGTLVKILDFGIAKFRAVAEVQEQRGLTRPGVVMGTPEYMAPEQAWSADTVDARADVYAVGVMLYEMLSGRRPVTGDDPRQIAQRVIAGDLASLGTLVPSLPTGLVATVHRAMGAMPEQRFPSARDLQHALLPFAGTRPATTSLVGMPSWTPGPGGVAGNPHTPPAPGAASPTPEASRLSTPPRPDATTQRDPLPGSLVASPQPMATSFDPGGTAPASPIAMGAGHGQPGAAATSYGGSGTVQAALPNLPPADRGPGQGHGQGGYAPQGGYAQQAAPAYHGASYAPPTAPPRKRGMSLAVMGLLAAVLGGGLAVAVVLAIGSNKKDDPPISLTGGGPPPTTLTTPSATAAGSTGLPPPVPVYTGVVPTNTVPATGTRTTPGTTPTVPRDAGAGGAPSADGGVGGSGGQPGTFPTIPGFPPATLPSGLPPMPSGLPTIPGLPPFPGFPLHFRSFSVRRHRAPRAPRGLAAYLSRRAS